MTERDKRKSEYGDFQTPAHLANAATKLLRRLDIAPGAVVEPSCGTGAFVVSAIRAFPKAQRFIAVDINPGYLEALQRDLQGANVDGRLQIVQGDFFRLGWEQILRDLPEPILLLGNPPWVTSSQLGQLESDNVPTKSNFQGRSGYEAISGKSNFDISEWMLLEYLKWLRGRRGTIAVLCKTAVARKILLHVWKHKIPMADAAMFIVDAKEHFDASVHACFLVLRFAEEGTSTECSVYESLEEERPSSKFGYHDDWIVSNVAKYSKWRHVRGDDEFYKWRSGIKHDCSKVVELEMSDGSYRNGWGEAIEIENSFVYPMLKSSDIGHGQIRYGRKYMLVTQRYVGEETAYIRLTAPKTWEYLQTHRDSFRRRASVIYRKQPDYAMFGVGNYSFAQWKVAISGFYKRLTFQVVAPFAGKPVVLDDTTYFLPAWSEREATFIGGLLNSRPAMEFLDSMIFWSDKRPITLEILRRLDLNELSVGLGCQSEYLSFGKQRVQREREAAGQLSLQLKQGNAQYALRSKPKSGRVVRRTGRA